VSAKETLMLIDVYSLLNRAFYGMAGRNRLTAPDGLPTGALFAFLNMLSKYRDELRPTHVVSALDMPGETFRHRKFDEYKKGRSPMPDDLARQVPVAREMLEYLGFQPVGMTDYEADDLIGTLSQIGEARGMSVKILTGDRDTLQLISDNTSVVLLTTKRDGSESEVITPDVMMDEYNLSPSQWVDVKGLMGDASDNIPGVRGVGQKTAIKLIQEYGSIDGVYENLGDMKGALLGNLTVGEQMAKLSRELSVICRSVPLEGVDELLSTDIDNAMDREALAQLLTRLNFRSFLERFNLTSPVTGTAREDLKVMADRIRVCASIDEWLPTLADDDTVAFMLPGNGGDGLLLTRQSCFHFSDPLPILHLIEQCRNTFVTWDFKRQLRKNGLSSPARAVFDVMIASYLLNELGRADDINFALRASLGDAYQPYEDSDLPLLKDLNAERKRLCLLLLQSMELQTDRLDDRGVSPLAQVEMELVNVLADMEHVGVLVDIEALETESSSMLEEIESLERSIYLEAGKEFNINSPQQQSGDIGHGNFNQVGRRPLDRCIHGRSDAEVVEISVLRLKLRQIAASMEERLHITLLFSNFSLKIQPSVHLWVFIMVTVDKSSRMRNGNPKIARQSEIGDAVCNAEINRFGDASLMCSDILFALPKEGRCSHAVDVAPFIECI
jgi:DNA polymerase-1